MQRLLTPNGGMPLELDDLNWIQDAYKEAVGGLLKGYAENCILYGCAPTNTSGTIWDITPGFVLLDSEVRFFAGVVSFNMPTPSQWFFRELNYNDPAGNEIFEDTIARDTYERREVELHRYLVTPPANVTPALFQQGSRLEDVIPRKDFTPEYDVLSYLNSYTPQTSGGVLPSTNEVLIARQHNIVSFRGQIGGGAINAVMFNISARFRSTIQGMNFICPYGADGAVMVSLNNSGNVTPTVIVVAPSAGTIIDLSGICYHTK